MKFLYCLFLVFIFVSCAEGNLEKTNSQGDKGEAFYHSYKQVVKGLPESIMRFVPKGFEVLDTAFGDLNKDGYDDILVVLSHKNETLENSGGEQSRPLLVLTSKDGAYKLAGRNDSVVYCISCGGVMGDPYMGLVIKNGYFSIEHYGGSRWKWARTITFKYSKREDNWFLHKDGTSSFDGLSDYEDIEEDTKILTTKDFGRVMFQHFNYNDIFVENQ